jgi:hypothetical protein
MRLVEPYPTRGIDPASDATHIVPCPSSSPHSLLHTLYAFYLEHERCGELDSAVKKDRIWMTCTSGR